MARTVRAHEGPRISRRKRAQQAQALADLFARIQAQQAQQQAQQVSK